MCPGLEPNALKAVGARGELALLRQIRETGCRPVSRKAKPPPGHRRRLCPAPSRDPARSWPSPPTSRSPAGISGSTGIRPNRSAIALWRADSATWPPWGPAGGSLPLPGRAARTDRTSGSSAPGYDALADGSAWPRRTRRRWPVAIWLSRRSQSPTSCWSAPFPRGSVCYAPAPTRPAALRHRSSGRSGGRFGSAGRARRSNTCAASNPPRIPRKLHALLAPHLYPKPRIAQGVWLRDAE